MLVKLTGKLWRVMPQELRVFLTRTLHPTFTASAAGIITNAEGKVLLLNQVLRPTSGWGVPGGFLNTGEQPEAALRREIREETGLELHDVTLYRIRTFKRHIEIVFLAKSFGEARVMTREITELDWFDLDDIPSEMNLNWQFLIHNALRPGE
jgi:8-oxo-dGTP diphosphatase